VARALLVLLKKPGANITADKLRFHMTNVFETLQRDLICEVPSNDEIASAESKIKVEDSLTAVYAFHKLFFNICRKYRFS
jgi:hypothetical protein